ncbi:MAG TPA: serine/threonine-protein kinase [Gallionellaceae bacterium]|nr:serine/threonine-protein kinase [Gallionellaceae bacterium]
MADPKLKQLGRYHIEDELGRGAMGVVYKAHDPVLDRTVALKTIALGEDALEREEYHSRFFQEAKAAARLNHPALITIYDFGEEGSLAYMAMELLKGKELSERMTQGAVPLHEAVAIAEQVAEGLAFAHDNGVIHRDIKPGNITLLPRGRVKIMDFGIARLKTSELKTQLGTRLGTPKYMSPEQSSGGSIDHRTDIFSLGIVLYEMLTGGKLFHGENLTHVLHNVATFEPPPPSRLKPEIPHLLDLVVMRALQKKPEARYASAWEMVDDLRRCLQELSPSVMASQASAEAAAIRDVPVGESNDKTVILKPQGDSAASVRRVSADVDTSNRMSLSRRFDSTEALNRLQSPEPRDRQRLARAPRAPGMLRRLLHDRDFAWFAFSLGFSIVLAAVLALS